MGYIAFLDLKLSVGHFAVLSAAHLGIFRNTNTDTKLCKIFIVYKTEHHGKASLYAPVSFIKVLTDLFLLFSAFWARRSDAFGNNFTPCKSLQGPLELRCLVVLQFVTFHPHTPAYHCWLCYRTLSYHSRCFQNLHCFSLSMAGRASCACVSAGWTWLWPRGRKADTGTWEREGIVSLLLKCGRVLLTSRLRVCFDGELSIRPWRRNLFRKCYREPFLQNVSTVCVSSGCQGSGRCIHTRRRGTYPLKM